MAAERLKGKTEKVVGAIKYRVGAVIENKKLQVAGRAESLRGEARRNANR